MKQLLYLSAAFLAGWICAALLPASGANEPIVETVSVYDTIPFYYAVARDSAVVRYVTRRLPTGGDKSPEQGAGAAEAAEPEQKAAVGAEPGRMAAEAAVPGQNEADSVDVVVPITQKVYQDSTYRVWISGYAVNLDSIYTFARRDYTTVTVARPKPKRWHLGVSAGLAVTPKGVQPYVGAGITYSFKSF